MKGTLINFSIGALLNKKTMDSTKTKVANKSIIYKKYLMAICASV